MNELDLHTAETMNRTYIRRESEDHTFEGKITTTFNTSSGGWMDVETHGLDEFVFLNVFIAKVRRESEGLGSATDERRFAWRDMANAFIDRFGAERTPPDILTCLQSLQDVFGI